MSLRTLILTILILAVIVGGYVWWSRKSSSAGPAITTPFTEEIEAKLREYRKIQSVSPNLAIFEDKLFQALRQGGVLQEAGTGAARGRVNPFIAF